MSTNFRIDKHIAVLAIDEARDDLANGEFEVAKERLHQAIRAVERLIDESRRR